MAATGTLVPLLSSFLCVHVISDVMGLEVARVERGAESKCQALQWPKGLYIETPRPNSGCPHWGPEDGIQYLPIYSNYPTSYRTSGTTQYALRFYELFHSANAPVCRKRQDQSKTPWPRGDYCLGSEISVSCPNGFSPGTVYLANMSPWGRDHFDYDWRMYFCCRDDGDVDQPMALPTDVPFYLYKNSHQCQQVSQTEVTEDFVEVDTTFNPYVPVKTSGNVPVSMTLTPLFRYRLCYYTPTCVM